MRSANIKELNAYLLKDGGGHLEKRQVVLAKTRILDDSNVAFREGSLNSNFRSPSVVPLQPSVHPRLSCVYPQSLTSPSLVGCVPVIERHNNEDPHVCVVKPWTLTDGLSSTFIGYLSPRDRAVFAHRLRFTWAYETGS